MSTSVYTVAVIIPTLNEERFIDACLTSILKQTYPFAELDVMVVDGGSTDKTTAIVTQWCKEYANVRLLENPGCYQSAAFNIGCKNSYAPYIIRMDAHTTYEVHYIERCIALLESNKEYGNVGGVCTIMPQNNSLVARANALMNHLKFGIGGAEFRFSNKAMDVDSVPFGAFRREIIEEIGGMREDLARGEDNEYNSRIRKAGYRIRLDPMICSSYYARPTISSSCHQMYANGKSIGELFHIDAGAVSLRHVVPLVFVLVLITCIVITCIFPWGFTLLLTLIAAYFTAALIASVKACIQYGWEYMNILPLLFFIVHVSYGCGTIVGLTHIHRKYINKKI